ncbi:MAG: spermidine synthase, partial [Acidobacteriota bacterium]|nr:spermidine synthase [Acidobacteriota bacterium]
YEAVRRVDLVEIDPAMTDLAATHPDLVRLNGGALLDDRVTLRPALGVSEGEIRTVSRPSKLAPSLLSDTVYPQARVRVYNLDADLFVRSLQGPYDLVIIDFPDPKSVGTAKLYSLDFYRRLARQLGPGGLVAAQSTSPYHSREMFLCIGKTLRAAGFRALPYRQNVPSFGEWGWHLAWLHETGESDMKENLETLTSIGVPTGYLTTALVSNATAFGKRWLDDAHIEINTKFRPTILQYHRQSWRN